MRLHEGACFWSSLPLRALLVSVASENAQKFVADPPQSVIGNPRLKPALPPRALDKASLAFRQAGNTEEADRLSCKLRERYPNYAGG